MKVTVVGWDDKSLAFNPGGDAIVGQRYDDAGNKVGGEIKLSGSITGADSESAITLLSNGNIALAFVHLFAGDQNIGVRILNPSLDLVRTDFIDRRARRSTRCERRVRLHDVMHRL